MAGEIGTGTTITFGTSGLTAEVLNINISGEEVPVIDVTNMGTTGYREKIFGDLAEPPMMEVEALFDSTDIPDLTAAVETVTLTLPNSDTLAGTAKIVQRGMTIPLEDRMVVTFTVQFDGQTGPTWSVV